MGPDSVPIFQFRMQLRVHDDDEVEISMLTTATVEVILRVAPFYVLENCELISLCNYR